MSNTITQCKQKTISRFLATKKITFLFAILFVVGLNNSHAQNTWTQKADFGGSARHGAAGFSIGSKGYIGIGYDGTYKKDFWEYDPANDVWTQKANFGGIGRHVGVGFSIGNKGYIGTGAGLSGEFNDFWEYDPATNSWTRKADVAGLPRHGAVGFSIGDKGYVGTGHNTAGNVLNDFWEYDPATDKWTQKANFGGIGRLYSAGFSIGTKGYVGIGNTNENAGTDLKDFWEYDPATDTWTRKADFAGSPRHGATGFSIGDKGYIGTGQAGESAVYNDFWEYDPATNVWTQKANFGGAIRSYAAGFSIGDNGYIGTGLNEINGYTHYKDFWEYTSGEAVCLPPTDLKVVSTTDSSAKLGWTLPTSSIVGLIIHYHPAGNPVWREKLVQPTRESTTLNKLSPNTTYKWKIESVCSNKLSIWVNGPDFITTSSLGPVAKANVYPNPARNIVTVNYTAYDVGKYFFEITDISGHVLLRKEANAMPGTNSITLDVSSLFKGAYFINIINPDKTRERMQLSKE
jgi:N-acetylneuraminic acid mutarotase